MQPRTVQIHDLLGRHLPAIECCVQRLSHHQAGGCRDGDGQDQIARHTNLDAQGRANGSMHALILSEPANESRGDILRVGVPRIAFSRSARLLGAGRSRFQPRGQLCGCCVAIHHVVPQGSSTPPRRSSSPAFSGSRTTDAPAAIARSKVATASST
ncbi:hypothetical protein SDC9_78425 [bioreactor metagenome]|uniref:Uncharacterized protein n=1 Tax=bioreactor metagenome TaxID=1076179 RepID=A0A644YV50_9ZZZZ